MKVLNVCEYDWANFSHLNAKSLRAAGVECVDLKQMPHHYNYPEQSKIVDSPFDIIDVAKTSDVIQIFHSDVFVYNLVRNLGKRIFVYHTGTGYRREPTKMNAIFKNVEVTFIDSPEFYKLGGTNVKYIATGIDTENVKYADTENEELLFAHYPSGDVVKGSSKIIQMLSELKKKPNFKMDVKRINYEENLNRMAKCDVYIEMFSPMQNECKYGSFGVTAFEAAALGKIVITNSTNHSVYEKYYGNSELIIANSEIEFKTAIEKIMLMGAEDILSKKNKTRKWIEEKHSLVSTGEYLKQYL